MRIESIKLQGFKSFRNEALLSFPSAVTAIVGPNGSGKSNVADAFRWVLGEQSLKTIRSRLSTDVIFSGSEGKSKLSRASVVVKFGGILNHDEGYSVIRLHLSEIEIARKIYQSGEAEYTLNKEPVRLLDIQLLLAEYNVGQKNYAVIGQGMIDDVLKMSPQARLDFFYEATGVKKYQIKLHKAELKLIRSMERLDQSRALLKEITPHKKYLERQAEKYTKREEIMEALDKTRMKYFQIQYWQVHDRLEGKRTDFRQIEKQLAKRIKDVETLEREMDSFKKQELDQSEQYELAQKLSKFQFEARQLKEKIDDLDREKERRLEEEGQYDTAFLHRRATELNELIAVVENEIHKSRAYAQELQKAACQKEEEKQRAHERLEQVRRAQNLSLGQIVEKLRGIQKLLTMEQAKKRIDELIEMIELSEGGDVHEYDETFREVATELSDISMKHAVILEKVSLLEESRKRSLNEKAGLDIKLATNRGTAKWQQELDTQQLLYKKDMVACEEHRAKIEKQIAEIRVSDHARREKIYRWQREYQTSVDQKQHVEGLLQAIKIEMTKLEVLQDTLLSEMEEDLTGIQRDLVKQNRPTQEMMGKYDVRELRREVRRLRKEAESLGEVEDGVLDEYKGVKDRFGFLTRQTEDLGDAIQSLTKITRKLRKKIKTQFTEKFAELKREFNTYFKLLFGGGSADVEEVDIEEEGQLGIDITAHPPGKKIKHIMSLSGGERSMVAVALICAIIGSNPPPFVILDEVDAALDEANSNRLADILKKLSKNSQLIIITHNRATMEIADVLYGVTMNSDGVSQVVGVKLEDYV